MDELQNFKITFTEEERLAAFQKLKAIIESGYAGVLPDGMIVDRREHPKAVPIPKNSLFKTPTPKPLP